MRIKILLLMCLSLIVPLRVSAQELPPVGSYSDDARVARIAELKMKYRISLNDEEQRRIRERCEGAQANLAKISSRVATSTTTRLGVYDSAISSVSSLRSLMAESQVDASNLELLLVDYQRSRAEFNIATTVYQTALDDALQIDCVNDPESFRASIEGVREARIKSAEVANKISELTRSSLKTVFDTVKQKLDLKGLNNGR